MKRLTVLLAAAVLALTGCTAAAGASAPGSPYQVLLAAAAAGQLTPTLSCHPSTPAAPAAGVEGLDPAAAGPAAGTAVPPGGWPVLQGDGAVLLARAAATTPWGQDPRTLLTAVMVGLQESSGNPRAGNRLSDGRTHQGLWQISSLHQELIARYGDRYNPAANAHMAYDLWKAAYDRDPSNPWQPWEAFTSGAYLKHEQAARKGIAEAQLGDTASEGLAAIGSDPCVPNDAGQLGGDVDPNDITAQCAGGGGQVVDGRTGTIRICQVAPGIVVNANWAPGIAQMLADARAAGLTIGGSGWRSHQRQIELYAQNCSGGRCSPPTARPGTSEHEDGLAVDLTCNGSLIRARSSECYRWLVSTGGDPSTAKGTTNRYGMRNLSSEPWHFSVDGT